MTRVPRGALIAAGVLALAVILWRRHARAQAQTVNDFQSAGSVVAPIPVSFSYIRDNAAPAPGADPVALDNAALTLLASIQSALVSNATPISSSTASVPRAVGVTTSRSSGGLELPFVPSGFTGEQVAAAAARYAQGRSYGGVGYTPHMVVQEGHVEVRNGVPGTYVKYETGGGSSTEWTPLT